MHIHIKTGDATVEVVPMRHAVARINELSGRVIGAYVIGQAHANRRRGRREGAYVACNRRGLWRAMGRTDGFSIEVVR